VVGGDEGVPVVGIADGFTVGVPVGFAVVGTAVGEKEVGIAEGFGVGSLVGKGEVGYRVGLALGPTVLTVMGVGKQKLRNWQ